MEQARVNGVELCCQRSGQGPRLLYCNGSGATLATVRPLLDVLAGSFDLLAFDQRGLGASSLPGGDYTMADLAADVAGLLDHVGWDRCHLSGLSFGGMVAQEVAVTWPERVDRLALLATSPGGDHASYPLEELADLPAAERGRRSLVLADRRWTPDWLATHPEDAALLETLAAAQPAEETARQRAGRLAQLRARAGHDVLDRLGRITAPTFVASGAFDGIAPVANGEAIAARIPDATLHVYQGGHMFLLQDPAAFADLLSFLGGA
jgi:3-oxoadipate enol-lactonase